MESKNIKVGDRVMCTDEGNLGTVKEIDGGGYVVAFDEGFETWLEAELIDPSEEPATDRKTEFLKEFQELLRKYDAAFADYEHYQVYFNVGDGYISFLTSDESNIENDNDYVDADNLFERAKINDSWH